MFTPFMLNVIIDRLGLMSAFYVVLPGFCFFVFIFLPSCGLLEHLFIFLYYLIFSVSELSIRISFLVVVLGIILYMCTTCHSLLLSFYQFEWSIEILTLYDLLFSNFRYNFLKYFLYLHLETKQCYKVVTKKF